MHDEVERRNAMAWKLLEFIFAESLSQDPRIGNSSDFASNAVSSEIVHLLTNDRTLGIFAEFAGVPAVEVIFVLDPLLNPSPNSPISSA